MAPSSSSSSASFQSTQFPDATDAICGATNWLLNDRVLVFNSSLIFIPLLSVLLHHFLSDGKQKKGGTTFPLLLAWFNQNVIKRSSEDMERLGKVSIVNLIIVEKSPLAKFGKISKKGQFLLVWKKVPSGKADFLKECLVLYQTKTILYYSFG